MRGPSEETHGDGVDTWVAELYTELRELAHIRMRDPRAGHTLQPTALLHEVYLRLGRKNMVWKNRHHFFYEAARAMRDILVEYARRRAAVRRGGDQIRVDFTVSIQESGGSMSSEELLYLHAALDGLEAEHPEHAELVLLYYFGGLTCPEIAGHKGMSLRSVERRMRFARAWLNDWFSASPERGYCGLA